MNSLNNIYLGGSMEKQELIDHNESLQMGLDLVWQELYYCFENAQSPESKLQIQNIIKEVSNLYDNVSFMEGSYFKRINQVDDLIGVSFKPPRSLPIPNTNSNAPLDERGRGRNAIRNHNL
jgi:hypothetical protein